MCALFLLAVAGAASDPYLLGSDQPANLRQLIPTIGFTSIECYLSVTALTERFCAKDDQRWLWSVNLLGFVAFVIFVPPHLLVFGKSSASAAALRNYAAIAAKVDQPGRA